MYAISSQLWDEVLADPVSKKSLKFVIAHTTNFRSESCVQTPTCGSSTFCGNASSRGLTCGLSGYTSRPTDINCGRSTDHDEKNTAVITVNIVVCTKRQVTRTRPSSSPLLIPSSSTPPPRAVFTSTLLRFIALISPLPLRFLAQRHVHLQHVHLLTRLPKTFEYYSGLVMWT